MITFQEYQLKAKSFATYRPGRDGDLYLLGKLFGEAGEFSNILFNTIRPQWKESGYSIYHPQVQEKLALELGDILWYVVNYLADHDNQPEDYFSEFEATHYEHPEDTIHIVALLLVRLIADVIDEHSDMNNASFEMLRILDMLVTISKMLTLTIQEVAELNIKKLEARAAEGKIEIR